MVSIRQLLLNGLVLDALTATEKDGLIREFADHLSRAGKVQEPAEIVRILMEREALGSTGIGDGIAIPHGKVRGFRDVVLAFGRSRNGVEFHSLDGKPVFLFFVLLTPDDKLGDHLKILARISRILKNPVLREGLLRAPDADEIRRILFEEDEKFR